MPEINVRKEVFQLTRERKPLEMTGLVCPLISRPDHLFPCQREKCAFWDGEILGQECKAVAQSRIVAQLRYLRITIDDLNENLTRTIEQLTDKTMDDLEKLERTLATKKD